MVMMSPVKDEKGIGQNKRILVDCDGVFCNYDFASLVKQYFGVDIDARQIFAYNLADVLGVSSVEIDDMFERQVWGDPDFIPQSIATMLDWKRYGHNVAIYSNRIKYMGTAGLFEWLLKWGVPFSGISDGTGDWHYHIDDRPEKLCDTNSQVKILYSQPWNQGCLNIRNRIKRVDDWEQIREIVG